jgi:hypothetical protein
MGEPYQGHPPFVVGSDTSERAADSVSACAASIREQVFRCIHQAGAEGATCDEVEVTLGYVHQTVSARICEMSQRDWIVDSGRRRQTRTNRYAVVWVAAERAETTQLSLGALLP